MKIPQMYELIGKLRVLAEDERTPEEEADSARRRMAELEEKIREIQAKIEENRRVASENAKKARPSKKKMSPKKALMSLKNKKKAKPVPLFHQDWPIGWEARGSVEVDEMISTNDTLILNWKCPSCGDGVERVVSKRHRLRLKGKPNGELEFVNRIRRGETNQLCDRCWEKNR